MEPYRAYRVRTEHSLAVIYKSGGQVHRIPATMRDISRTGVFFYGNFRPEQGSSIQLMLTFPRDVTYADPIPAHCKGRVVRVEANGPGTMAGIAVEIESYEPLAAAAD
jgi:hypothetical protein